MPSEKVLIVDGLSMISPDSMPSGDHFPEADLPGLIERRGVVRDRPRLSLRLPQLSKAL